MSKNSGHCCLLSNGDVPAVDSISVSAVLPSVSDVVVGDDRAVKLRITRGMIFSVLCQANLLFQSNCIEHY